MGTFLFKWTHPASEVYVTGTFDNWAKTEKLVKTDDVFEKKVTLSSADEKILYKFVVDGNWTTDHTAPMETDHQGNANNVLTTDRIVKHGAEPVVLLSSAGAGATTAALAKEVPLETSVPGSFPETPVNEPANFSVNPIPASSGLGNPVKLEAGEAVPPTHEVTPHTIGSTVTTDKESYENSAGGIAAPTMSSHDVPPVSKAMIPESSLPMGDSGVGTFDASPMVKSVGPESTTAALAAAVPLESSKVPDVVTESQKEAGVGPEASAVPEEVAEKTAVEKELLSEVPKAPVTSDGTTTETSPEKGYGIGGVAAAVGGGAVAVGGAAAALVFGAKDKAVAGSSTVASSLPTSVEDAKSKATAATSSVTSALPTSVEDAKSKATAAASSLTSSLPTGGSVEEAKSKAAAATSSLPTSLPTSVDDAKSKAAAVGGAVVGLGGAATALAVGSKDKAAATEPIVESSVPTSTAPATETAPPAVVAPALAAPIAEHRHDSRDISPTTMPGAHAAGAPPAASGPATPAKPTTPGKFESPFGGSVESPSSATQDKKKKRTSFFGKLKSKFSDKDKK